MNDIHELRLDILDEGTFDYVGLWQVAHRVRSANPQAEETTRRQLVIDIIRPLVHQGLVDVGPTDVDAGEWEEHPWLGPAEAIMGRIEALWDELGEPKMWDICWMLTTEAGKAALKEEKI